MKTLLTGSTGFLGKNILAHLVDQNYQVTTIGRNESNDIDFDFSANTVLNITGSYDLIIHSAGKAHSVPKTEADKDEFYKVNVDGTKLFLDSLASLETKLKFFIFISSVAVYGLDTGINIDEDFPLIAKDPYGKSKVAAEKMIINWCSQNNVLLTILRLPLLVGHGAPGNLGTMVKGIKGGYYFNVAGGKAKKSMVLVSDVVKLLPVVAKIGGTYNLTDGCHPSFKELSFSVATLLNKSNPLSIPLWIAQMMALVGDLFGNNMPINSNKLNKIISDLTFNDNNARDLLNWDPEKVLKHLEI
ncbi:NAD-dependent epimerase/dehydratase family protein [Pedobacter miscanthi]|uniref:NAD(P)-dependent oxidoreductase n=1 Tax=Pedobacter miscanthi TaxID=2259170 RepID=A0A366KPW9_9SPHI|nr:NAD-dependent epimerase/dehydratase family protein [Pedobacter miscanthi]RBQ03568.1 NAD(P)-dependent oxidoreductase [Pedobacter miscanthi]